jgi:hypothetical protein
MVKINKLLRTRSGGGLFSGCIVALAGSIAAALAADNDQEILNQLYQEIISSAPSGKTAKRDSLRSPLKPPSGGREIAPPPEKLPELPSERVKQEIEKIVQDAKIRHSDAIKFIQDSK